MPWHLELWESRGSTEGRQEGVFLRVQQKLPECLTVIKFSLLWSLFSKKGFGNGHHTDWQQGAALWLARELHHLTSRPMFWEAFLY